MLNVEILLTQADSASIRVLDVGKNNGDDGISLITSGFLYSSCLVELWIYQCGLSVIGTV